MPGRGPNPRWSAAWLLFLAAMLPAVSVRAVGPGAATLRGHVPSVVRALVAKEEMPESRTINLAIGLAPRDPRGLDDFLEHLYTPGDPLHRRFLTPEQFAERFGPTAEDYDKTMEYARRNGLTVTATHPNRLVLDVSGSPADIRRAFHVNLRTYRHPTEDREFFAPDEEPTVDAGLAVTDVSGLTDYVRPKPRSAPANPGAPGTGAVPMSGSGTGGSYFGKDFRAAYLPGVGLIGTGQSVGLLQFDGFYASDIAAYATASGLAKVPVETVLIDGFDGVPTTGANSGNSEVSLDIEMAMAMAPGLSKIVVFEAGSGGLQNDILVAMVARPEIKQFGCSWGWGGGPNTTTDNLFKQMAAQGQSFFVASGDNDAFAPGQLDSTSLVNSPAGSPYVTVVGGTTLSTSGAKGHWVSEKVWNNGSGNGSGGGISSHYTLPTWQAGISTTTNGASSTRRNTPDLAMVADNIEIRYGNGKSQIVVGTSCAAPLWAGMAAIINQRSTAAGRLPIGFLNPTLYAIGKDARYATSFHDIVVGNNFRSASPSSFRAVAGYDLCTGWGTPKGAGLLDAFAGPPDGMVLSPARGFDAAGAIGGPFTPTSTSFFVANPGVTAFTWSATPTVPWIDPEPAGGTLQPGESANVVTTLTAAALDFPKGKATGGILFSNLDSGVAQWVSFSVDAGDSLLRNGDFELGGFVGWNLVGVGLIDDPDAGPTVYNGVEGNSGGYHVAHGGSWGAFMGDSSLATLSQTIPTIPGQAYLVSFWLSNPTSGEGQRFEARWIPGDGAPEVLYNFGTPRALVWTRFRFVVVATDPQAVLQFAALNSQLGFGLDDVIVLAIPPVAVDSVARGLDSVTLGWRALAGLGYQVQYKNELGNPDWTNLGPLTKPNGTNGTFTDPDPTGLSDGRLYRLTISP